MKQVYPHTITDTKTSNRIKRNIHPFGVGVYIIIVNWNGLSDTLECLQSIKKIDYPNYKIVIIDNGSKNNEAEAIKQKYPEVHLIKNKENRGFTLAANQGIEFGLQKKADYILLLNNDTVVSPDFLSILVDYSKKHENVGAVGPKMLYYNSNKIWFNGGMVYWWIGFNRHLERLKENSKSNVYFPLEVDYVTGCCFLIKREVLKRVGKLDPIYITSYEDVDWCFRAKKLGYKNLVLPKAIIWHKVSAGWGEKGTQRISRRQAYYYSRNAIIFARKHLSGIKKFVFLVAQFTCRLWLNLILCKDNQTRWQYLKGLIAGFKIKAI